MRRVGFVLMVIALVAPGCGLLMADSPAGPPDSGVFVGSHGASMRPPARRPRPVADISGKWSGSWRGYDVMGVVRNEDATADLRQQGSRGTGRFVLHTTGVAAGMPIEVRNAGLTGLPVQFEVSGSRVAMRHELGSRLFAADFEVEGDRMLGRVRGAEPEVRIVLTRVRPSVAAAPGGSVATAPPGSVAAAAPGSVAPEPPPPPSSPPGPTLEPADSEPSTTEPPIAAAPASPPEPTPAERARPGPNEFTGSAAVKPIYFDFNKYAIRPGDARILEANAEWLRKSAAMLVLIEGHCDERGTIEYNLALGERRARAARDYLISNGIAAERISIVSFGAERPVCTEATEECWSKNRRAVFLLRPR